MTLESCPRESVLVFEDGGDAEDLSSEAPNRGRPLALAIARWLLGGIGGRVEASRVGDRTRVGLVFGSGSSSPAESALRGE